MLLLLLSSLGRADVETLLRRAETRLAHGNEEGALELYRRALEEDPTCGPALAAVASDVEEYDEIALHLRYLTDGVPLDEPTAARFLTTLARRVVDPPERLMQEAERVAMTGPGSTEAFGPWRPWHEPDEVPPSLQAAGPLRSEALHGVAHACREALLRVAVRFDRERVSSPRLWARLAVCLGAVGEQEAADAALSRAAPRTLDDHVEVASCALRAAGDPAAWWAARGEALLAEIVRADPPEADRPEAREVLDAAYVLLAKKGDLRGAAALAPAFASCHPAGARHAGIERLAQHIGGDGQAEQAFSLLDDERSPVMLCLRAALLSQMGQHDLALQAMEALLAQDPDDLLVLECLAHRHARGTPEWARAVLDLEAAARRRGVATGPSVEWECAEAVDLLSGEAAALARRRLLIQGHPERLRSCARDWRGRRDLPALAQDLADAMRKRAASGPPLDRYDMAYLLPLLLELNRPQDALLLIEATSTEGLQDMLTGRNRYFRWEEFYGEMKPLLRLIAVQTRQDESVDAFLRLFPDIEPSSQVSFVAWRLREDLSRDESFKRLPSADYVLSCLYDPVIDRETFRSLRRSAVRSGCRSRTLLMELVAEGEPLLGELESVDPVAARLARARLSGDEGALAAFLASDDMTEDQFLEARRELRRRRSVAGGGATQIVQPPSARERFAQEAEYGYIEDPYGIVWEVLQEAPPSRWTLDPLFRGSRLLPPSIAEALKGSFAGREGPDDAFLRSSPSAAELAGRRLTYWDDWQTAIRHVVEKEGKEGIRALLSGPYGLAIARWMAGQGDLRNADGLPELVRDQGRVHPLDLGWLGVEDALLKDLPAVDPRRREIALAQMDAGKRDTGRMARAIAHCSDAREKADLVERVLARVEGLPPGRVIPMVHGWSGHSVDPTIGEALVSWATPRCRTVEDRLELCSFLNRLRRREEADQVEAGILRDGDSSALLRVLRIRYGWQRGPVAVEALIGQARAGGWTTSQARGVWGAVCNGAAREGREDLFVEALGEIWRDAPIDWTAGTGGSASSLTWDNAPANAMTAQILGKGEAPQAVAHFALGLRRSAVPDDLLQEASRQLADLEPPSFGDWLDAVAGLPRERLLERLRAALSLTPIGRHRDVLKGVCARLGATGRIEDAVACVDLWASRFTTHDVRSWQAPPVLTGLESLFAAPTGDPPAIGGLPRVPGGAHALPGGAATAEFLGEIGWKEAAGERLGRAAADATDPVSREACRMAEATLFAEAGRAAEAMRTLLELRADSTGRWLRAAAALKIVELFQADASAREAYIDVFLADSAPGQAVSEADLRAWEVRLSSDLEPVRQQATEELRGMGEAALGVLGGLRGCQDPEVGARVEDLLEQLLEP